MAKILVGSQNLFLGGDVPLFASSCICYLWDIVNVNVHHRSHYSFVTTLRCHFLFAILDDDSMDLIWMVIRTFIIRSSDSPYSTLPYPYLITYSGEFILHTFIQSNQSTSKKIFNSSCFTFYHCTQTHPIDHVEFYCRGVLILS